MKQILPDREFYNRFLLVTVGHGQNLFYSMRCFSRFFIFAALAAVFFGCKVEVREKPLPQIRMPGGSYVMEHDARPRKYILRLPVGREHEDNLPLVVALHGGPGHAKNLEENSGLTQKGQEAGFIVVYPEGTSANDPAFLNWNSGSCCGYAWENKIDDVGFLRTLVERLVTEYHIDRKRIFAAGFSKGGMMAYRLACEAPDLFSAIADVGGAFNLDDCNPERKVNVLIVHGRADKTIRFGDGMPRRILPLADSDNRPVAFAIDFWQKTNECAPGKSRMHGKVELTDFRCIRAKLRLIAIEDEGHTWPGGKPGLLGSDNPTQDFSINDAIWDFWSGARPKAKGHR